MPSDDSLTVDASEFPRLAAYIDQLPEGLDSHVGARAKASIVREVYSYSDRTLTGLPLPLQVLIDKPPPPSTWLPQCQVLALIVAIVESQGLDGQAEVEWIRKAATKLFSSRMYQVLMWAATPRMVFKSAGIRWSAFFRGSTLSSKVGERDAELYLDTPPRLFNQDLARIFVAVIYAAVNYTRDEDKRAELQLVKFSAEQLTYTGEW